MAIRRAANPSTVAAFVAAFLAWLVPGAGHLALGRPVRAAILFFAITATFWAGVGMGGAMTINPGGQAWWFAGQMCAGLNGLVAWQVHLRTCRKLGLRPEDLAYPGHTETASRVDARLAKEKIALVAPTEIVALAYSGIAGMLNLLCIFDALMLGLMGIRGEPAGGAESSDERRPP